MDPQIQIHSEYENMGKRPLELPKDVQTYLDARRQSLLENVYDEPCPGLDSEQATWLQRSYPILAIAAPVMSTSEGKIEFPGDPMCMYTALSYAVDQVVQTRQAGLNQKAPYNDLCPQWGYLPTAEYRANVDDGGIRQYDSRLLNTDQTVFDPRVWNEKVREYFIHKVLLVVQPKIVLIGAVSPAHRYAIDIARTIRAYLPDCLIVLGGRHTDETLHFDRSARRILLEPSGTLRKILDGSVEPVFDFWIAGDGYYAVDVLLKVASLSMDLASRTVCRHSLIENLSKFACLFDPLPGNSLLVGMENGETHAWPLCSDIRLDLKALPAPYSAFAIRALFPIFKSDERILRTAHFMVTSSCTYHCYFCSEGVTVVGVYNSFQLAGVKKAIERVIEYLEYGAEAIFFDDSIFWGGNFGHAVNFARELIRIREMAAGAGTETIHIYGHEVSTQKLLGLQWGAQFTVDLLASRRNPEEAVYVLEQMKAAGCCYLYIGIESMSAPVIERVHKNVKPQIPWEDRVRTALGMVRMAGITVGSSILFGLDGETDETISETINKVEDLLAEDLLAIASPNILTYHPNTDITALHGMKEKLDYHSMSVENRPPYVYFEEAFPAVVSRNLSEEQIWLIHEQSRQRWGAKRNTNPMPEVFLDNDSNCLPADGNQRSGSL